jgi:hypothetical protein
VSVSDSEMVGSRVEKGREEEGRERERGCDGVRVMGCGGWRDEERRCDEEGEADVEGVVRSARLCERV